MNDDGFDIDEWEDMLPEERRYEKEHSFRSCGGGKISGWTIVGFLLLIYAIVDAIVS